MSNIKKFEEFLNESVDLEGTELMNHINVEYISKHETENDESEFNDYMQYMATMITWGLKDYLKEERPEDVDNYDLIDDLTQDLMEFLQV